MKNPFGYLIKFIAGNPIMPLIAIGGVIGFTSFIFTTFWENNYGVEFFVEGEPEQAIVYVKARGNLSLTERYPSTPSRIDRKCHPGVESVFLSLSKWFKSQYAGASAPKDTIGQPAETIPGKTAEELDLDGKKIIAELSNAPLVYRE